MAAVKDRFDKLPRTRGRVGAHRGARRTWVPWLWVLVAAVAACALTLGGLKVASGFMDLGIPWLGSPSDTTTSAPTTGTPAITDPSQIDASRGITIRILNGTPMSGLQDTVGDELTAAGWPILGTANAGSRTETDTVVYFSNPADWDVAEGLVQALGVGTAQSVDSAQYPGAAITVVLGEDHPAYAAAG